MKVRITALVLCLISTCTSLVFAQLTPPIQFADDVVPNYQGVFRYGMNFGYYGPNWTDAQLAQIAAGDPGAGVNGLSLNTIRLKLPDKFINQFGINVRANEFNKYEELGMGDLTIFTIGGDDNFSGYPPANNRRDASFHCAGQRSYAFANLYEPIWVNVPGGKAVNPNNYYAKYVYDLASHPTYGPMLKFWEVWNEPDFVSTGLSVPIGARNPGEPGNWWENNPNPCDLIHWYAPVQHYIRMLRITYEVVKAVDPDDLVAVGGIGYPAFLDAIMRQSDNPNNGIVNASYPRLGGSYFDVVSFHIYPQYTMRSINGDQSDWTSDEAADIAIQLQDNLNVVLEDRGYDGTTFPRKLAIMTETSMSRKALPGPGSPGNQVYVGGEAISRNYILKLLARSQLAGLKQVDYFQLAERRVEGPGNVSEDLMGLFRNLDAITPFNQQPTPVGLAMKTMSQLLFAQYEADPNRTANLNLPAGAEGVAFRKSSDPTEYIYVLWARASGPIDQATSIDYSFPPAWGITQVQKREWNFSQTGTVVTMNTNPGNPVTLTEAPAFFTPSSPGGGPPPTQTTWNGSTWDPVLPDATLHAIIAGNLTLNNTSLVCDNLTVNPGGNLVITNNGSFTVNGDLTVNGGGNLRIQGSGSLFLEGGATGVISARRNISHSGFAYLGSPFQSLSTDAIPGTRKHFYNEASNGNANNGWVGATGNIAPGRGIITKAPGNVTITGVPNTGNVSINVTRTGSNTYTGYNLLSNPYPAAVRLADFMLENDILDGTIWMWRNSTEDYVTRNSTSNPDYGIGTMQGFFVQADQAGQVNFTPAMRHTVNSSFFRSTSTPQMARFQVEMTVGETQYNDLWVAFAPDFTEGFDRMYDGHKWVGNENFSFYARWDEAKFAILALPEREDAWEIPLTILLGQTQTVNFQVPTWEALEGASLYLWNKETNQRYPLLPEQALALEIPEGENLNYSLMVENARITSLGEEETPAALLRSHLATDQLLLWFGQPKLTSANVTVYSLTGQKVFQSGMVQVEKGYLEIPCNLPGQQLYLLLVETDAGVYRKKLMAR